MVNFGKVLLVCAVAAVGQSIFAESPEWVLKTTYLQRVNKVLEVRDDLGLVKIDTGSQSNLLTGAICRVYRNKQHVGDVVIVDSDKTTAVATIISDIKIEKGDAVYITPAN